jgi:enediyne biosynthesis protein E4
LVEGHYEAALKKIVPWKHWDAMSAVMPFVRERYNSFHAFSEASVEEILGATASSMRRLSVTAMDSMVFLNTGTNFVAEPLPIEAQFSPVFGVSVADLDNDGTEDIFLTQNFFGVDPDTARYDAGRGLWLRGKGDGTFTAVRGQESGILIYGEARGAALCDYDIDGRVDIAAGQNGTETKLYRNVSAPPGLRVRVQGPGQNAVGVGAIVRPVADDKLGPARELHIGSGYWSQDSTTQVFPKASKLWIRWPGGKTNMLEITKSAKEVILRYSGQLEFVR